MVAVAADWIVFWVIAPISVVSAAAMIIARNAVHSALLLIVNFFTLAVFFLILGSPFLFVVQIIVYAGAIMVLFLFVIMLLGVDVGETLRERLRAQRPIAVALGAGLVAEVVLAVRAGVGFSQQRVVSGPAFGHDNVQSLARVLFSSYFFPFEVTSVLLIVAAIGAMLHGRRSMHEDELGAGSNDAEADDASRMAEEPPALTSADASGAAG